MCCPPKRDDANNVLRLGMHNRHRNAAKQVESHEALLVVAKPVVFIRRGKPVKYEFRLGEVKVVSLQVGLALSLVPLESHVRSVYTQLGYCNAKRRRLTPQFSGREGPIASSGVAASGPYSRGITRLMLRLRDPSLLGTRRRSRSVSLLIEVIGDDDGRRLPEPAVRQSGTKARGSDQFTHVPLVTLCGVARAENLNIGGA
jgi:hypothetical protein